MSRSEQWLRVTLAAPDDPEEWRDRARQLIRAGIPPDRVIWSTAGDAERDLFTVGGGIGAVLPGSAQDASPLRVPRGFIAQAETALLHSNPRRFDLLYRLLWRMQRASGLLDDHADAEVRQMHELVRSVRRDIHKMRAFVRFRLVEEPSGQSRYVAWFEPAHHILRANASFFINRFNTMNWSILTPRGSLHWDCETLLEGPPARREDGPIGDPTEQLWQQYYSSIFNPARLKIGAMLKEMPRRYWRNLPEAQLIPGLIAGAQSREAAMVDRGKDRFTGERPASLAVLAKEVAECRRCPIGCNGTRAVTGEGRADAAVMIIGEQPGDTEEATGRPFVGPAGELLRQHLTEAGFDIGKAWVTNAVKHFKFEQRGKRRLHQSPTAKEIDICRWWIESERALIRPRLVLALGASAARSLFGRTVNIQEIRSKPQQLADGSTAIVTAHPSYLLRLDGQAREIEVARFQSDLAYFADCANALAGNEIAS
ncbi:MAG: UdgX family uracil-DNA binding protein [Sphingomonadales bacterium]|nr:UdgX family uracil-DNA binding protein [Sphingomonadales bacterium]